MASEEIRQQAEKIVRQVLLDAGCDFMAEDSVKFVVSELEAAERVRGERVVYASEGRRTLEIYNGVHLEFQETLRHKDVLVIRKAVK